MRATDVDLIQMAHTPIARRNSDILELHVHVVFSYTHKSACICVGETVWGGRTFEELATVDLAGGDLECDNMALQRRRRQYRSVGRGSCVSLGAAQRWDGKERTCASFSSLIGMPIVLVMMA
jgi:hypothetical protein